MPSQDIRDLVLALSRRDGTRTEATIQANVRQLLLAGPLDLVEGNLDLIVLESPLGDRRRIDVEVGSAVIEVKRDLRRAQVRTDAVVQLAGYVAQRETSTECRYVGILTDGAEWRCFHLSAGDLVEVSTFENVGTAAAADGLLAWLEGVLATTRDVPPTPAEISRRLGATSSAHAVDRATLADLYQQHATEPEVQVKRRLWARLLTTALGTQFQDTDELFVEHTLLVCSADVIAHAVLGLAVEGISPASLLSGAKFEESGIFGVVEADFFDWVLEVPGGDRYVRSLARRLNRFAWGAVNHDVLKVLYESVIGPETRKRLGEYYTPDWLAECIVREVVRAPLEDRVLDPACGSGTFLFHAVRLYLDAADQQRIPVRQQLHDVTRHVYGMDLHPVAVTLARVTYVLALGRERLSDRTRESIHVPVYLGDSLQWRRAEASLWSQGHMVIPAEEAGTLLPADIRFPDALLEDAPTFDRLVKELAERASSRAPGSAVPSIVGVLRRLAVPEQLRETVTSTYRTLCSLHDEGRDHIWGYYIRNLARPLWLSREENRVSVLIGNPPWLAYRNMPEQMQNQFRSMSQARGLWEGDNVATHQDLSGLFLARAVQLYLRSGGSFGFVLPNAALDRRQFRGFRTGRYPDPAEPTNVAFTRSWDLRRLRPHFFPRGSGVVFGRRAADPAALPAASECWTGRLTNAEAGWGAVAPLITRSPCELREVAGEAASPYADRFAQGATLVPRVLLLVEERQVSALGVPAGRIPVKSRTTANEKKPWKSVARLEGVVESEMIRPAYLSESVLPYAALPPALAIVPWAGEHPVFEGEQLEMFPGLAAWLERANRCWLEHRSSDRLTLAERVDFRHELSSQFPIQPIRVVYTKSGMHLSAAIVEDRRAVVDHTLYVAPVASREEGLYLCGVLNSALVTQLIRPLMSYGKDERDIHKLVWELPIPSYDRGEALHAQLVDAAREVSREVAAVAEARRGSYVTTRRAVRAMLAASVTGRRIEALVAQLLEEET